MSCRELERLFVAGGPASAQAAHRKTCLECEHAGRDAEQTAAAAAALSAPAWSPSLRAALLEVPRLTVSCEGAGPLMAQAMEGAGEIAAADERRLRSHLSRCAACTEAADVLLAMRDLAAPEPPPWLATRLVASRPTKRPSRWRALFSGRAVVFAAYAAAIVVMLLGWNPTAVARKAGFARLGESTRAAVTVAQNSLGDRLGALQEETLRTLAVWKGHVTGYGRAAVSNAIAIVWRPEKKQPSRPRLGKEGGNASGHGDFSSAASGRRHREPFVPRFRV